MNGVRIMSISREGVLKQLNNEHITNLVEGLPTYQCSETYPEFLSFTVGDFSCSIVLGNGGGSLKVYRAGVHKPIFWDQFDNIMHKQIAINGKLTKKLLFMNAGEVTRALNLLEQK